MQGGGTTAEAHSEGPVQQEGQVALHIRVFLTSIPAPSGEGQAAQAPRCTQIHE